MTDKKALDTNELEKVAGGYPRPPKQGSTIQHPNHMNMLGKVNSATLAIANVEDIAPTSTHLTAIG